MSERRLPVAVGSLVVWVILDERFNLTGHLVSSGMEVFVSILDSRFLIGVSLPDVFASILRNDWTSGLLATLKSSIIRFLSAAL
jgi:hypothetical protein